MFKKISFLILICFVESPESGINLINVWLESK